MRIILCILASLSFFSPRAQTYLPVGSLNYAEWQPFPPYHPFGDSSNANSKWHFSTYSAVSAGFGFLGGRSATILSAPVGLQLTRELNNNLYAFAGVSVAPAFYSFSHSFMDPAFSKSYPGGSLPNTYSFGLNSRIEMGLMYINDAKTFSISGSIGIDRSSYPVYYYPSGRPNIKKQ